MRSEQEMMNLILSFACHDERIKIVGMEGSRTNPNVPRDHFQDYDISYLVTDMASFKKNDDWLTYFGERIIMQKPEDMALFPPELGNWFSYLMLFEDGNRIDLTLIPLEECDKYLDESDGLVKILLDKDGLITNPPTPTDAHYHVQKPSAAFFEDCCNEFWWVSTYVVKGLCRKEFLFAVEHLNKHVRPQLLQMLAWQVGIETSFTLSVGKSYKYLERHVVPEVWIKLCATHNTTTYEDTWSALFACHALFRNASSFVAQALGYMYPDYDEKVSRYTKQQKAE